MYFAVILTAFVFQTIEACKTVGSSMDCGNRGLVDCPEVNRSIISLNMSGNRLETLTNNRCSYWTHLRVFLLNGNKLTGLVNLTSFPSLTTIDLSHNRLVSVTLFGDSLHCINLFDNNLHTLSLESVENLETLVLGHNHLSPSSFHQLLFQNALQSLKLLDLSYNDLLNIPIEMSKFSPPHFQSLNLSGNRLTDVVFSYFNNPNLPSLDLDLSHNQILSIKMTAPPKVGRLDLSFNQLAAIDNSSLTSMKSIKTIDLSNNPFNCSCLFWPPFIAWLRASSDHLSHQYNTNCKDGTNIFLPQCRHGQSRTSSWWWLLLLLFAAVLIAIAAIGITCFRRQRRSGYTEIGNPRVSPCFPPSWMSMDCLRQRLTTVDPPSNQHLDFTQQLTVLCSSSSRAWVSQVVVCHLSIIKEIIDCRMEALPRSKCVLIVVNGDQDMKDSNLVKNVADLFERRDTFDIRLLLRSMPRKEGPKKTNVLTRYVQAEISNESCITFNPEYPLTCVDALKLWLNEEVRNTYPYSV